MTEKGRAIWFLALLSPVLAELLSGSAPPLEFFFPINLALLVGLYGAGVLVMRELSVRWNLGWVSIIVMGFAYAILEEGVAVKSFFDPEWMDLGDLGVYGRYLDTNWVWTVWLTIFHSMVSITLPIFIFGILYPGLKNDRLLSGRQFRTVLVILFIDVLVCTTLLNPYVPNLLMYLLAIVAVFLLVFYAKQIPKGFLMRPGSQPSWPPWAFIVFIFFVVLTLFITSSAFAGTGLSPLVPMVMLVTISAVAFFVIVGKIGDVNNLQQKVYLACGFLVLWVFIDILLVSAGGLDMAFCAVLATLAAIDFTRWSKGKRVFVFHIHKLLHGPSKPAPASSSTYKPM